MPPSGANTRLNRMETRLLRRLFPVFQDVRDPHTGCFDRNQYGVRCARAWLHAGQCVFPSIARRRPVPHEVVVDDTIAAALVAARSRPILELEWSRDLARPAGEVLAEAALVAAGLELR